MIYYITVSLNTYKIIGMYRSQEFAEAETSAEDCLPKP